MSNAMSVINTILLQRQLDLILKPHGQGGGSAPVGQKFADVAETQFGIPFAIPQALGAASPRRLKRNSSKDRNPDDKTGDDSEDALRGERRSQRNPRSVDVRV